MVLWTGFVCGHGTIRYCGGLENRFPKGYPGSNPGGRVGKDRDLSTKTTRMRTGWKIADAVGDFPYPVQIRVAAYIRTTSCQEN